MYEFAPLHTPRLTLRSFTPDDVDDVLAWMSDPGTVRYMPFEPRSRAVVETTLARFAAGATLAADGDSLDLAIELGERVIGTIHFTLESVANSNAEIGWALAPGFQGHGYAAEAASAMLDVAFGQLALHRVFALLDPRNEASIGLCVRLGMRPEAHFVENVIFKGERSDTAIYALLAREWMQRGSHSAQTLV